jgi:hypothetical protein
VLGEFEGIQSTACVVADLADVFVCAGIVVTGADQAATLFVVEWDLVDATGQPGQDVACFAKLVAEVGRNSGRGGGVLWISACPGEDFRAGRGMADRRRVTDTDASPSASLLS